MLLRELLWAPLWPHSCSAALLSPQSCSTQSEPTCARWRSCTTSSTRGSPGRASSAPVTRGKSSPTWRISLGCMVGAAGCCNSGFHGWKIEIKRPWNTRQLQPMLEIEQNSPGQCPGPASAPFCSISDSQRYFDEESCVQCSFSLPVSIHAW